jgi:hypothetical protein
VAKNGVPALLLRSFDTVRIQKQAGYMAAWVPTKRPRKALDQCVECINAWMMTSYLELAGWRGTMTGLKVRGRFTEDTELIVLFTFRVTTVVLRNEQLGTVTDQLVRSQEPANNQAEWPGAD